MLRHIASPFLTLLAVFVIQSSHAQFILARYEFESGLADTSGQQAAITLSGGATWEPGRLSFASMADKAEVTIPNSQFYIAGQTQAIELDAWIRTDAFLGNSVGSAYVMMLLQAYNAQLSFLQDKWQWTPRSILGYGHEVVSATTLAPYWQHGISHHLQLVIDAQKVSVWVDGQLLGENSAVGELALWGRSTGVSTLSMGMFHGVVEEVTIKRHNSIPAYVSKEIPFEITEVGRGMDGQLNLRWNSRPGTQYTVETSSDLIHWTPEPLSVMTATTLSTLQNVPVTVANPNLQFARVRVGNAFDGQGPLLLSHTDGQTLIGSSALIQWLPNSVGVDEWVVKAGSVAGGADYFQSISLPASSTQFTLKNLPTSGELTHVTLSYRKGVSWYEKRFTFTAQQTDALPSEREGIFPIARPSYAGIDQILVLDNRWVIAAVVDTEEVADRINTLSGGQLFTHSDNWDRGTPAGNPARWDAWTALPQVRDTYIAQARIDLDESRYTRADYYAITSPNDSAYATAREPTRATQYYVGLDGGQTRGMHNLHYAHYCYLEMPDPMISGHSYTITLDNGKAATFLYDESRTVSRAIKVNQSGYLPDSARKYAYIGACVHGYGPLPLSHATTFEVINAQTGAVAHSGSVTLREANPRFSVKPGNTEDPATRPLMLGEDLYQIDLNGLTQHGWFFIRVPGVGRSWTFRHAPDAYGEAFYTSARGLYHQRANSAYQMPFTPWSRIKAHSEPIYESALVCFGFGDFDEPANYQRFDIVGATLDLTKATPNVEGGWYDAADWDRNLRHYTNIFDMLYAYEIAPAKFVDGQLNIPESGNGVPDILDEVEYGLEVWTRSMTAAGGVSGMVETSTHPSMTDPAFKYGYSQRTRWSSLLYAAAAAQLSEMLIPIDATRSNKYRQLALKAYSFGADPANSLGTTTIPAATNRGLGTPYSYTWTELASMNDPYLFHAKLRLHYLTGDTAYLSGIESHLIGADPWGWPNTLRDCVPWFYFSIAHRGAGIFSQSLIDSWRRRYINGANERVAMLDAMPYRHTWPRFQDYFAAWGEMDFANRSRLLLQAYALTNNATYRDTAACNMDYMFGGNAMGMSWTTGIGYTYPAVLQHEVSANDAIDDPVPGISIYGLDGGPMHYTLRNDVWSSPTDPTATTRHPFYPDPGTPFYRRWVPHPTANTGQCEFTVHETMSATLFTCAMLLPDGWVPPQSLKQRKPRHRSSLFGYWYLP